MGLTLREGDREYYYKNLDRHFPGLQEKYREKYGNSYILTSGSDKELMEIFNRTCDEHNIVHHVNELFNYLHAFEGKGGAGQPELF
jgi:hypothetical protein